MTERFCQLVLYEDPSNISSFLTQFNDEFDLNQPMENGVNAFSYACLYDKKEALEILLKDERIEVNEPIQDGLTAFYRVCELKKVEALKVLLGNEKVDVNKGDYYGTTPFAIACWKGHEEIVKRMVRNERVDINKKMEKGESPIFILSTEGNFELIKYLIASGREIDLSSTANRQKGLSMAIKWNLPKDLELYSKATKDYLSPLDAAQIMGHHDVFLLLSSYQSKPGYTTERLRQGLKYFEEWLWDSYIDNDMNTIEKLLQNEDLDLNWINPKTKSSILYMACEDQRIDIVKQFLDKPNIDVNLSCKGKTPLCISSERGFLDIIQELLNHPQIDVNLSTQYGETPLFLAGESGHLEVIKVLIETPNVRKNSASTDGRSPFYVACEEGHFDVIQELLKYPEININQFNSERFSPLHVACQNGHLEIVKELLKKSKLVLNQWNLQGETPLLLACNQGHSDIVRVLLSDSRVEVNHVSNEGKTSLIVACLNGKLSIVKWILSCEKEIDMDLKWKGRNAKVLAKMKGYIQISDLLCAYESNRLDTIYKLQRESQILDTKASDYFGLIVLISDNYLKPIETVDEEKQNYLRFLRIASSLPQELQMVLVRRMFGLDFDFVSSEAFEHSLLKHVKYFLN